MKNLISIFTLLNKAKPSTQWILPGKARQLINNYLLLLVCLLSTYSVSAQPGGFITLDEVPQVVQQKFLLLYPKEEMTTAQWEYENGGYEAYIKDKDGRTTDVVFFSSEGFMEFRIVTDEQGLRTGTQHEISLEELPENVKNEYKSTGIIVARKFMDINEKIVCYWLISQDTSKYYDHKGNLIEK